MIRACLVICVFAFAIADVAGQSRSKVVKQPPEVIEAYQVCREFQRLFGEDLDFDRAFEATFTKDPARRRAIARAEIEMSGLDLTQIDDATLVGVYKDETQLFWLLIMLIDPDSQEDKAKQLPEEINNIFDRFRVRPKSTEELREYAAQLKRDVIVVRDHLKQLAAKQAAVAERIRAMKKGLSELELPNSHVVQPLTSYRNSNVLSAKESYYQIGNYDVVREGGEMKIIGIRFFTRLF